MSLTTKKLTDLSLLPCQALQGVGSRVAERLSHLGIHHVQDLLFHLPLRYQDRTRLIPMARLIPGDHVAIEGMIENITMPKVGRTRLLCQLRDTTGQIRLRFFYINTSQRQSLQIGVRLRCFGEVRRGVTGLEMIHPECQCLQTNQIVEVDNCLTPIYPTRR